MSGVYRFYLLVISLLFLAACTDQNIVKYQCSDGSFADSTNLCPTKASTATDLSTADCSTCPVKTQTKTITQKSYVCQDLSEATNKEDCLKTDSEGWYEVKTFESISTKTTESFKINSKRWRYTVECNGANEYSIYNLQINKIVSDRATSYDFKGMVKCEGMPQPNYVFDGPAEYSFDINLANIKSVTIKIEAKK